MKTPQFFIKYTILHIIITLLLVTKLQKSSNYRNNFVKKCVTNFKIRTEFPKVKFRTGADPAFYC